MDVSLLRRRTVSTAPAGVGVGVGVGVADVGTAQPDCMVQVGGRLGPMPSVAFVVAYSAFLLTGVACTLTPPLARSASAGADVPPDATCYRVLRKADYTAVEFAMGSPTRRVEVLLRLDKVVADAEKSVKLFTERLMESKTFSCDAGNATCYDALLLTQGPPNSDLRLFMLEFDYVNPQVEYYTAGIARYTLKLAGEMYAAVGYRYYLTNSHLCVSRDASAPVADTTGALEATVDAQGKVQTRLEHLVRVHRDYVGSSALYSAWHGSQCNETLAAAPIDVFPHQAGAESVYLAISDAQLYENEPEQVSIRRRVVELGAACASTLEEYERAYNLYDLDCSNAYATCRTTPSLPFRRVSTLDMRAHYTAGGGGDGDGGDGKAYFWFGRDNTLATLPGLANTYDAVGLAVVKLLLMVLAASVMWIRSDRVTSNAYWLYRHCLEVSNCVPFSKHGLVQSSVVEDAALGLVALSARFAVALWRLDTLHNDDQARVCVFELLAAVVSFVHWLMRYWVIEPNLVGLIGRSNDGKGPLTRLGGSMAACDASNAVLLAFAEPPLLLSAISRFDSTARLLTGMLVSLVTLHRALYACCCNAVILEAHDLGRLKSSAAYRGLLLVALSSWVFQAVALAVGLADLVATPMAFAISRGVVGESSAVGPALFFAFVCASLPRLLHTSVRLADASFDAD